MRLCADCNKDGVRHYELLFTVSDTVFGFKKKTVKKKVKGK